MPSTRYDAIKDDQDMRIPMHAEEAFEQGITFQAKVRLRNIINNINSFGIFFYTCICMYIIIFRCSKLINV